MPTNETGVVREIVQAIYLEYPEAWGTKIHGSPYQPVGIPDLLFCIEGRLVALEVKHQKPGESREHAAARATPAQLSQINGIRRAGGTAHVVCSAEEALRVIQSTLDSGTWYSCVTQQESPHNIEERR